MNRLSSILDRIGYNGPTEPTLDNLQSLQHQFLLTVPFENLDISLGVPISLDIDDIYGKIVERDRGGFCYECNSLFFLTLQELGFRVHLVSARIVKNEKLTNEFGHMVLIVDIGRPVLVDVGNGQSCRDPIPLDDPTPRIAEGIEYRVRPVQEEYDGEGYALELRTGDAPFLPRYVFSTRERRMSDFHDMCHYHQTSPESLFTQGRLVTRALPEGRMTLSGNRLTTTRNGEAVCRDVPETEIGSLLLSEFGIDLAK